MQQCIKYFGTECNTQSDATTKKISIKPFVNLLFYRQNKAVNKGQNHQNTFPPSHKPSRHGVAILFMSHC
ncbi:hypothetical protein V5799_006794 [Amblyomma americanum]|uniref:Uncharacterized protein n=1 Tax=Amblyomma americanum TaxID=6943 RepID=A0AAQ4DVC9_AMBAM